jgi:hypothetical protein
LSPRTCSAFFSTESISALGERQNLKPDLLPLQDGSYDPAVDGECGAVGPRGERAAQEGHERTLTFRLQVHGTFDEERKSADSRQKIIVILGQKIRAAFVAALVIFCRDAACPVST